MRKDYDFVGSYDNQRVTTISAQRTVNMFEYMDPEGKRPKVLLSTSGLVDTELNFEEEIYYTVSSGSLILDSEMGGGFCPGLHRLCGARRGPL
jgi:hypothetical protein